MSISQTVRYALEGAPNQDAVDAMPNNRTIGEKVVIGFNKSKDKTKAGYAATKDKTKAGYAATKAGLISAAKWAKGHPKSAAGIGVAGGAGILGSGYMLKQAMHKTPSEKAHAMAGSIKDVIKNKIMEHPKAAMAAGAAGALGAGYGAYRYLKGRGKKWLYLN